MQNLNKIKLLLEDNKLAWSRRLNITRYYLQKRLDGEIPFKDLELEIIAEFYGMELSKLK